MRTAFRQFRSSVTEIASGKAARFASGSAAAFLVYVLGHGLALLTQLAIARQLGAGSYGMYAYVVAWMAVLAYTAMLGFNVSLVRFIPTYAARKAWPLLAGVIRYAERRVSWASVLLVSAGALLVLSTGSALAIELRNAFLIGFFIVPLLSLMSVRCAIVRAYGGVVSALLPMRVIREGFLFAFACIWLLRGDAVGPAVVVAATVVGLTLAFLFATRTMYRHQPQALNGAKPQYDARAWRQATFPMFIVTAVEALFDKTGVLMLGFAGASQEAGIFALVFNMAMLVVLPRTAVDTIFAPTIARLYAEERYTEVQSMIVRASLLSLAGAACVVVVLAVIADPVLGWFGSDFAAGRTPLTILLMGQLFAAAGGSQLSVLAMTGNEADAARNLVLSALVNALLCAALVSLFGMTGAAIATAAALVVWNLLMAFDIRRKLRLWPGVVGLFRPAAV
jgi:O-antigen/teichoic acid export membrane protein